MHQDASWSHLRSWRHLGSKSNKTHGKTYKKSTKTTISHERGEPRRTKTLVFLQQMRAGAWLAFTRGIHSRVPKTSRQEPYSESTVWVMTMLFVENPKPLDKQETAQGTILLPESRRGVPPPLPLALPPNKINY